MFFTLGSIPVSSCTAVKFALQYCCSVLVEGGGMKKICYVVAFVV